MNGTFFDTPVIETHLNFARLIDSPSDVSREEQWMEAITFNDDLLNDLKNEKRL